MINKNEGYLIIDKPKGVTSFGVIARLRRITGIKKIGHCGTLDPLATGVLVCAIGRSATRDIDKFRDHDKVYIAEIEFGIESDSYDLEGVVKKVKFEIKPKWRDIKNILHDFSGEIEQAPPIYSAKKINGVRAYKLARAGKNVQMRKKIVIIYDIKKILYRFPFLKIKVHCGKGTYIRSLAHDIGQQLGCGGVLINLRRIAVGNIKIDDAIEIAKLDEKNWKKFLLQNVF